MLMVDCSFIIRFCFKFKSYLQVLLAIFTCNSYLQFLLAIFTCKSPMKLWNPDTLDSDGDKQLSWFVNPNNGIGGWRCGTTKDLSN